MLMPVLIAGRMRLIEMSIDAGSRDRWRTEEENLRRAMAYRKRLYYEGDQYDATNRDTMIAKQIDELTGRLDEVDRLHAYSTQIRDAVDFIAGQLAAAFEATAVPEVEALIDASLRASDQFSGQNEDDEVSIEDVMGDALQVGDVAVEVRWDPIDEQVYYECWEGEQVEFRWANRRTVECVIREEMIWVRNENGDDIQVLERVYYDLVARTFDETETMECRRRVFYDQDDAELDTPRDTAYLGVPFIPWKLLRGWQLGLRATRGSSIISDQACEHADRYNANEQAAWLTARFNSHGNLAVIGDAAALQAHAQGTIHRDVADVLVFPGGTAIETIHLPTDASMIEHQRKILAEAIYQTFGLTRIEPETINGLGRVSGYALEILNRKTDGTFRRVRRTFSSDLKSMFVMMLDMTAYKRAVALAVDEETDEPEIVSGAWWLVDPAAVFPNREIEIRMGSGYIVDDVMVREDFTADLISRQEALRARGRSDEDIARIEKEIGEQKDAAMANLPPLFVGANRLQANGQGEGTRAGDTVGTASRG